LDAVARDLKMSPRTLRRRLHRNARRSRAFLMS
jgi:hypothetical protein